MVPVGKHVAEVLVNLTNQGLDPKKLELLGFSLGCQTISYIAKNYQQMTGRNISKLTALSPAGPCFRNLGPEHRLSPTDADFVEVIHTNIDGFGMATRMGHIDFYVNGGEYQPSDLNMYPCTATCSHFRSLLLWESALKTPKGFIGLKCDSIQQARDMQCYDRKPLETNTMGLLTNRSMPGIYYLATSLFYPYYLKDHGLNKKYVPWMQISNLIRDSDV